LTAFKTVCSPTSTQTIPPKPFADRLAEQHAECNCLANTDADAVSILERHTKRDVVA